MKKTRFRTLKLSIIATILVMLFTQLNNVKSILAYPTATKIIQNKFKVSGGADLSIETFSSSESLSSAPTPVLTPNEKYIKHNIFTNNSSFSGYIRAQVWVPIIEKAKIAKETEEGYEVETKENVESFSYKILQTGWKLVDTEGFSGEYTTKDGKKYKIKTYKYVEDEEEKIFNENEGIDFTIEANIINYLEINEKNNMDINISALYTQSDGGEADEMWEYYKNKCKTAIVGVEANEN